MEYTHIIRDAKTRKIVGSGKSYGEALEQALGSIQIPDDFGAATWDEVADLAMAANDGLLYLTDDEFTWERIEANPSAVALGRLGGQAKSEAKTKAARENAKKPRPRKIKIFGGDAARQRAEQHAEKHGGEVFTFDDIEYESAQSVRNKFSLDAFNRNKKGVVYTHVVFR